MLSFDVKLIGSFGHEANCHVPICHKWLTLARGEQTFHALGLSSEHMTNLFSRKISRVGSGRFAT